MFNRVAFWVMNIWFSFVLVTSLINFFFDFNIITKWNVTNHIVEYLRALPFPLGIVTIVIRIIILVLFTRGWWLYPKSKVKAL